MRLQSQLEANWCSARAGGLAFSNKICQVMLFLLSQELTGKKVIIADDSKSISRYTALIVGVIPMALNRGEINRLRYPLLAV